MVVTVGKCRMVPLPLTPNVTFAIPILFWSCILFPRTPLQTGQQLHSWLIHVFRTPAELGHSLLFSYTLTFSPRTWSLCFCEVLVINRFCTTAVQGKLLWFINCFYMWRCPIAGHTFLHKMMQVHKTTALDKSSHFHFTHFPEPRGKDCTASLLLHFWLTSWARWMQILFPPHSKQQQWH